MEYITLNSGEKMPMVGTGTNTYGKENNDYNGVVLDDIPELRKAINLGYRSIDSAKSYRNEALVGRIVAESKVSREEFFITTKIKNTNEYIHSKSDIYETIETSLKNFQTDYIDLYLIHHPIENKWHFQNTWKILEEYHKAGKIRSIGVSNFDETHLDEMKEFANIKPAVNQIQINLKHPNTMLLERLRKEDITPVAWGPMMVTEDQKKVLKEIGRNYNKNWGQILLKYQIQRNIVVIPKSHNPENQKSNLELFNFELTDKEIKQINQLT